MSSNRALSILKRTLKQNNIVTKVGHFGTLDPIAEGVLPVALGRATRLFDYSLDKIKTYRATFRFGIETDTLDRTGTQISVGSEVTAEQILRVIPYLIGEVDQVPPLYSAKTIDGVRAYKMARKGKEFSLPPKRVSIFSIELVETLDFGDHREFVIDISCGGGTYIRSIVRDMAKKMGTVGIMTALVRTSSGIFTIDNAVSFDQLEKNVQECILPMELFLEKFPKIVLAEREYKLIKNGITVPFCEVAVEENNFGFSPYYRVFSPDGVLLGVGESTDAVFRIKTWLL